MRIAPCLNGPLAVILLLATISNVAGASPKPTTTIDDPSLGRQVTAARTFTFDDLRQMRRDRHIDVLTEPGAISLVPFLLLFDETGKTETGVFHQSLSDRVWAKKEFVLDEPGVRWAQLYFLAGSDKTTIHFNGKRLNIESPRQWAYGNWGVVDVPVDSLKKGFNEIIFSGSGSLYVENSRWPNRSARSVDAGQTWDYEHIGTDGAFNGEFTVRLGLGRYPAQGVIWSDGIEIVALASDGAISGRAGPRSIRLGAQLSTPPGTEAKFELRTGTTPEYDPLSWDAWHPVPLGRRLPVPDQHRYVQWRAILSTGDPWRTPLLQSVSLQAMLQMLASSDEGKIKLVDFKNQRIVRSSYHFVYQKPTTRLGILRRKYDLDQVVISAPTELEKFVALRNWTRHQWGNGWVDGEYGYCAPPDALLILDLAKQNKVSAFCGHYAEVLNQSAGALGYTGRLIEGRAHAYSEVWSNQYGKWIIMDPGPAVDDKQALNYHYEYGGVPMSALDLHKRLLVKNWEGVDVVTSDPANDWEPAKDQAAMKRYLYIRIRFRNNQLDSPVPGDINVKGWPSDTDVLVWRDGAISKLRRDYPYTTNRQGDFYWTLNQVAIYPSYGDTPGQLHLEFDTQTPNFKTYQVRIDDGDWTSCAGAFDWPMHVGRNRLETRPINAFDVPGIVSSLEVDYAK